MNKVLLTGRLTRDPELRALASGKSVTTFAVTTNEYIGNGRGSTSALHTALRSPAPTMHRTGMHQQARTRYNDFIARHEVAWELSFAALAVFYVALAVVPDGTPWVLPLEWAITGIFAVEFGSRLWAAPSRRAYMRGHWIDVVALVPPARWLRTLRLLRLLRLVRAFAGIARAAGSAQRLAQHRGLIWLLAAWVGVMVITALGLYEAEEGVNPAIQSLTDAVWWGIATMTTVGYGDVVPVTPEGRLFAAALMILGIGLFAAVTATMTSFFLADSPEDVPAQIEKLAGLRTAGALTEDEFSAAKAQLLARL